MLRGLWTAATGMSCQQINIDVIAHNLANVNTNGFKKSRAYFQDLMYQTMQVAGASTASGGQLPSGIEIGMGARVASVEKLFLQGDYVQTKKELDMAIEGKGFFKLISNGREVFTRNGAFKIDKDGYICDHHGNRLQPEFAIPAQTTTITIDSGGRIVASGGDGKELGSVQIQLFNFPNPAGLKSIGQNLFIPSEASGDPIQGNPGSDEFGTISQGFLEMSNVDVVEEMINMIMAQRAYEIGTKVIQTGDDMLQMANNLKR
ncbi:MAG: flagellar basal-body rod protein FlgG [Candidatus Jordarchaeum sp.]|uniref:flagellar basal-body rod protein FlgG n=1 Tax=Candidatus Jordarchaeum sp. TaxID=2823881 RepID=UPI004049B213